MANRLKWYMVTSARAQAVTLPNGSAKQMPRGTRFQADAKAVKILLRRGVIREIQEREVPIKIRFPNYDPVKSAKERADTIAVIDEPMPLEG